MERPWKCCTENHNRREKSSGKSIGNGEERVKFQISSSRRKRSPPRRGPCKGEMGERWSASFGHKGKGMLWFPIVRAERSYAPASILRCANRASNLRFLNLNRGSTSSKSFWRSRENSKRPGQEDSRREILPRRKSRNAFIADLTRARPLL